MSERGKRILVADLDPISNRYQVVDETNRSVGEKSNIFGYLKPKYNKNGGCTNRSFESRKYKAEPPWFKYEITEIDGLGGNLTFHIKTPERQEKK